MIPKIIHFCWFGGKEIPERDRTNIEGWKRLNPDYEIIRWDETNCNLFKNKYTGEAFKSNKFGFVPDFIRTDIIYTYGGFYFDTDVEMLKPLDDLLGEKCIMGFEKKDSVNHGHGFGAEKGHPFLKKMLDFYENLSFINDDGSLNTVASPVYLTNLLVKEGLKLNNKEQYVNDIHIFPTKYFCPKDYLTGKIFIKKCTYSIHHFNLSWMDSENKQRLYEIQKMSRFFGNFIARNIVDLKYSFKKDGFKGFIRMIKNKIVNKRAGRNE